MNDTYESTAFCKHSISVHCLLMIFICSGGQHPGTGGRGGLSGDPDFDQKRTTYFSHLQINGLKPYELQTFFTPKKPQNCKCSVVIATTVARFRLILMIATRVESVSCQPFSAGRLSRAEDNDKKNYPLISCTVDFHLPALPPLKMAFAT